MLRKIKRKSRLLTVYKIAALAFFLVLALLPKSVTNMPEIESKLLLTSLGLDRSEDGYTVSATAVMPQESHDGSTMRLSIYADGKSVSEALDKLSIKMGKQPELGLCGLVVVGNELGKEGVAPQLEYLLSSGKIIPGAYLAYSPEHSAKETIELSNELSEATSNGLSKLIENVEKTAAVPAVTLHRFLSSTHGVSHGSYMPCIQLSEKTDGGSSTSGGSSDKGGGGESNGKAELKDFDTVALFGDGKLSVVLNREQTRGFTWTDRESKRGHVSLEGFGVDGVEAGEIYCQLLDKRYRLKSKMTDGSVSATIFVDATLSFEDRHKISELYRYHGVSEQRLDDELRKQFEKKIEGEISLAVDGMLKGGVDAIGIEEDVYRHFYKSYRAHPGKGSIAAAANYGIEVKVRFK